MAIHDKTTGAGGSRAYYQVRSKIAKGKDGHGKVISIEREKMLERLGYDPGPDVVFQHKTGGSHFDKSGDPGEMGSRADNTSDSNKARSKRVREKIELMKKK